MISLVVSGVGAVVAAVGSGVLLARCFREPRGDIVAWSIALLGLLVSLGSQALGHLAGFDPAMFRGMEIGGQVIAPLALILGLSEVAAKRTAVRFCARLYIPALAIVALVVLGTDQLAQATFSKAWPDPSVFYQLPPDYVLMFGVGPVTALIALIAAGTVMARSSEPGWDGALAPQLMATGAALALAYPCLAQLVAYVAGIHLPVGSVFAVLCTMAAGLTWAAGVRAGELRLAALHSSSAGAAASSRDGAERGRYRDDHEYWRDRAGSSAAMSQGGDRDRRDRDDAGYGWQDDRDGGVGGRGWRSRDEPDGRFGAGYPEPDFATGDFVGGDFAGGDFARQDFAGGAVSKREFAGDDFATGDLMPGGFADDHDLGYQHNYDHADGHHRDAGSEVSREDGQWDDPDRLAPAPARAATETRQAELFGQIAIYTVLEDRVEEFDQLTARVVEQVRSREPDTLVFIVHAVPSAPMQRILYEVYRDRTAYQWHSQQSYVRQFEADRRPYVLATNVIELGLQQAKVSAFPSVADLFGEPGYDTSGFERPDFLRDYGRTSGQRDGSDRGEYR
jgi:quinol monooxygenase YgiN